MTTYVNLNDHAVSILHNNQFVSLPAQPRELSAKVIVKQNKVRYDQINQVDVPIFESENEIENLPDPEDGVIFIVNSKVAIEAALLLNRTDDLVFPDNIMRHPVTGQPIGATNLKRIQRR